MIRSESPTDLSTERYVFISVEGPETPAGRRVAHLHAMVLDDGELVADFGSWINPLADTGGFGLHHGIPAGGFALTPALDDFLPLLLRQAAGARVLTDSAAALAGLLPARDISDLGVTVGGDSPAERCHDMLRALREGMIAPADGQVVPAPEETAPGVLYLPSWAPTKGLLLDTDRATDADLIWSALSGGPVAPATGAELLRALETLSGWAVARGGWNAAHRAELTERAARLSTTPVPLPEPLPVDTGMKEALPVSAELSNPIIVKQPEEVLESGTRVAFSGSIHVNGQLQPHGATLQTLCEQLDLELKQSVTRTRCDVLVTDDIHATTSKARQANKFSKPLVTADDFGRWAATQLATPMAGQQVSGDGPDAEVPDAEVPGTDTAAPTTVAPPVQEEPAALEEPVVEQPPRPTPAAPLLPAPTAPTPQLPSAAELASPAPGLPGHRRAMFLLLSTVLLGVLVVGARRRSRVREDGEDESQR